jgi:ribosomal-protein-alanine N-acetyltransferase
MTNSSRLPEFHTARLLLRPVVPADAEPTARLVSADVAANLSTWPSPMSVGEAREKVRRSRALAAAREAIDFAIVASDDNRLIGWIGLAIDDPRTARLGYWLAASARGRGLMKEAVTAVVPGAAEWLGTPGVKALVLEHNAPSIAVLTHAGFRLTGEEEVVLQTAGRSAPCYRFDWSPTGS